MREHRKKLCCVWGRENIHTILVLEALRPATGRNVVIYVEDQQSTPKMLIASIAADNQQKTSSLNNWEMLLHLPYFLGVIMRLADRKNIIRDQLIEAAQVYSSELAGKCYLYVYRKEYFEVFFGARNFLHLTGVNSSLQPMDFYNKAKDRMLTLTQFGFSDQQPITKAMRKLPCLIRLPELTNNIVCVAKDIQTEHILLKLSLTNIDFTLGLVKDTHKSCRQSGNIYVPRTLRVRDKSIEKSAKADFIDFIFSKRYEENVYSKETFHEKSKQIPLNVESFLNLK